MAKKKEITKEEVSISIAEILQNHVVPVGTFKPKFNPRDGHVFSDELNIFGTAFWVKEPNVLITCAHVVDDVLKSPIELAGLLIIGYQGKYYRTVVGVVDHQHDLAVLKVIDPIEKTDDGIHIADVYPNAGTDVAWAGYPLGNFSLNQTHQPTYNEGVVGISKREEGDRKNVQISGLVVGGYSGSPVVEKKTGRIVGVVSNGPQNTGIFMAISWEHVAALARLAKS